jgi:hypothetical protein
MRNRIWIIALLLLSGCMAVPSLNQKNSEIKDGGFLSSIPCGAPCFYGLNPGLSTDIEAVNAISANKDIFYNCEQYDDSGNGGNRGYICNNNIGVVYSDDLVGGVSFQPSSKITVKQAIEKYGYPDLVDSMVVSLPDKPFRSGTLLYFNKINTVLKLEEQSGTEMKIDPDTNILEVIYWSKGLFSSKKNLSTSTGVPWHGFGTYEAVMP